MRRKQLHALDHPLLLIIEEPILTWLKTGNDRMPCGRRMLGRMLARRTVAATDVPTLGTPTKMKPPTCRGRQAFYASFTTRFRSRINSVLTFFHCRFSSRLLRPQRADYASLSLDHQPQNPINPFQKWPTTPRSEERFYGRAKRLHESVQARPNGTRGTFPDGQTCRRKIRRYDTVFSCGWARPYMGSCRKLRFHRFGRVVGAGHS